MTRRKQNYPKRLKCSPSEGGTEQGAEDSGGEKGSPVATDEEEEEEEEEATGEADATTATTTSVTSQPQCDDDVPKTSDCEGDDVARGSSTPPDDYDDASSTSVHNPSVKVSESQLLSTNSISPALSHSPSPAPTPISTSTPDPLASLSTMTVPATFEAKSKDSALSVPGKAGARPSDSELSTASKKRTETSSPSRMASVIVPMAAVGRRPLTSPDRVRVGDSTSPLALTYHQARHSHGVKTAASSLTSGRAARDVSEDQPLDLSKKSSRPRSVSEPDPPPADHRGRSTRTGSREESGLSNGISSLQSLQKRFGGDFLMEPPRRPSSIIPLQSTIMPSKASAILRPPPIPTNGLSHLRAPNAPSLPHLHPHAQTHHHHGLTTTKSKPTATKAERLDKLLSLAISSNSSSTTTTASATTAATTTARKPEKTAGSSEPPRKADQSSKVKSSSGREPGSGGGGSGGNSSDAEGKYTIHRCSCQKSFGSLFALSAHLQETGHMPGTTKQASLMDYPKLVRGQDMWLNQESEQTRRILRCMQCGESFKSLPMLTVHMMQTQHYSKIVSAEHGRRSHKCSAYCDRELDRECIFKCKVCQETFTDMEGLANHMIVSGHHKKQVLRSHNYAELGLRHKQRKRFLSDEAHSSTVASLLEYKRKLPEGGSNGYLSQIGQAGGAGVSPGDHSPINCESCGKKIEMSKFVDHVRQCLRQKAEVIDALKSKLSGEETASYHKNSDTVTSASRTPDTSSDSGEQPLPSTKDSALYKRLNSLRSSSPCDKDRSKSGDKREKSSDRPGDKDSDKPKTVKRDCEGDSEVDTVVKKIKREPGEVDADDSADHKDDKIQTKDDTDNSKSKEDTVSKTDSKTTKSAADKVDHKDEEQKEDSDETKEEKTESTSITTAPENTTAVYDSSYDAASPPMLPIRFKPKEGESKPQPPCSPATPEAHSYPPKISSPLTDEDNTSERTNSPHSVLSQSGDSKPPSPSPSRSPGHSIPKPVQKTSAQLPLRGSGADDFSTGAKEESSRPEKREHKDGEEDPETVVSKKKIKLEPDTEKDSQRSTPVPPVSPSPSPSTSAKVKTEAASGSDVKPREKSLDIIDPDRVEEPKEAQGGGSSALKAMESFIQRSFSSKFDSRRNASLPSAFAGMMGTSHLPPLMGLNRVVSTASPSHTASSSTASSSSISYLSKFSRFFSPSHPSSSKYLDAGFDVPLPSYEKNVLSTLSARSAEILEKSRNSAKDSVRTSPASTNGPKPSTQTSEKTVSETVTSKTKAKDSGDEDEEKGKRGGSLDDEKEEEEDLTFKYLNPDVESDEDKSDGEEEDSGKGKSKAGSTGSGGKQSALDSLSSFVYGQPMTSEHPLDSLQRLLTKSSVPRMMSATAGPHLPFNPLHHAYFPEQMMERMCYTPPDRPASSSASTGPLNLSLKPGGGGGVSGSEDDDTNDQPPPDCGSPSLSHDGDEGGHSSPGGVGPDGEMVEYKCAACSRRFASKGSYRYHLSRCHLSSVKKYGIKEAFNMSPYVYLPLDHTAKFTKYYQMAQELANKGK